MKVASITPWNGYGKSKEEKQRIELCEEIQKSRQEFYNFHSDKEIREFLENEKGCTGGCEIEESCLCRRCAQVKGYFRDDEKASLPDEDIKILNESWDDNAGWFGPGGCRLPRKLRSMACLSFICFYTPDIESFRILNPMKKCQLPGHKPDVVYCKTLASKIGDENIKVTSDQCRRCGVSQEEFIEEALVNYYFSIIQSVQNKKRAGEAIEFFKSRGKLSMDILSRYILASLVIPRVMREKFKKNIDYFFNCVKKADIGIDLFEVELSFDEVYEIFKINYLKFFEDDSELARVSLRRSLEGGNVDKRYITKFAKDRTDLVGDSFIEDLQRLIEIYDNIIGENKDKPFELIQSRKDICLECEHYRISCKTGEFCLLKTREVPLHSLYSNVNGCPVDKWSGLVSVIILARNEEYLKATLENVIKTADGPIEIICVLDGPTDFELLDHELVTYIVHDKPKGRRPSTNIACQAANGKYLFHLDAHVKTDTKGWDILFKSACVDNKTMIIPNLNKLKVETWTAKGRRMGHKYVTHKMKDSWSGVKCIQPVEPTITGNGMGWFLTKDYFDAFGGCDSSYGVTWGNFGLEWALKVWLTDPDGRGPGRLLLHNDVVFAHMWKKDLGYKTPDAGKGRSKLWDFVEGTAKNQVRPFSFFEENFPNLIPVKSGDKAPLIVNKVTVIMNTNGLFPELIEEAVESFNRQDYPHKHLNIICTHPDGLSLAVPQDNITIDNIEPPESFPHQIAYAIGQVKTPFWCVMDSDDIFSSDHISQMVKGLRDAKNAGVKSPFYVKVPVALQKRSGKISKRGPGWWCCLYEKMSEESLVLALSKHKKKYPNQQNSFDLVIRGLRMWNQHVMKGAVATVMHRVGVAFHVGFAQKDPGKYARGLEIASNQSLRPLRPQWRDDYESDFTRSPAIHIRAKNHLGDVVCIEPTIRNIRLHKPNAEIFVYSKFPALFSGHPDVSGSFGLDRVDEITYDLKVRRDAPLVLWLNNSSGFSMEVDDLYPKLEVSDEQLAGIECFGIDFNKPAVVINTRTKAIHKRWNREKWTEVVSRLQRMGFQCIQVGTKEKTIAGVDFNLSDQTSIAQLMALCSKSAMYVGIDAGVQHVAVACGIPAVVLFGPARPSMVVHKGWTWAVETKGICNKCRTSVKIGRRCPDGHAVCMFKITVEQVLAAVEEVTSEFKLLGSS